MGNKIELCDEYIKALGLWDKYNIEYRTIIEDYDFYLRIKKELGIKPVNKLSSDELADFPVVSFLVLSLSSDAKQFLFDLCFAPEKLALTKEERKFLFDLSEPSEDQEVFRLKKLIDFININYVDNGLICNLRTRISDYKRQIRYSDVSCSKFGYDPDRCTNGCHTRQHKVLASSRF